MAGQTDASPLSWTAIAWEAQVALIEVDFSATKASEVGKVTALEAPHGVFDALFLACTLEESKKQLRFRPRKRGQRRTPAFAQRIEQSSAADAHAAVRDLIHGALFGLWDSHGARGRLGQKFQSSPRHLRTPEEPAPPFIC